MTPDPVPVRDSIGEVLRELREGYEPDLSEEEMSDSDTVPFGNLGGWHPSMG